MKIIQIIFYELIIAVIIFTNSYSCGDDSLSAPQDFVSGNILYIDNQFNFSGGYYAISLCGDCTDPFNRKPISIDSVAINSTGKKAYYKISGLAS